MQFKPYAFPTLSEKVHEVFKFCSHTMTSREILCETNFMEASNFIFLNVFLTFNKTWTFPTLCGGYASSLTSGSWIVYRADSC